MSCASSSRCMHVCGVREKDGLCAYIQSVWRRHLCHCTKLSGETVRLPLASRALRRVLCAQRRASRPASQDKPSSTSFIFHLSVSPLLGCPHICPRPSTHAPSRGRVQLRRRRRSKPRTFHHHTSVAAPHVAAVHPSPAPPPRNRTDHTTRYRPVRSASLLLSTR